ncbi:hypothetical protein C1H87_05640 [Flavivirga eckloniae]|uniref:Uncharacterized protein n=2 Tax=Flavivirga eckloniae TaxID=1803846 RepID=A0A2K9PN09_9FLAO|nr:hypothetical protein C1H87_05640 [Flavivirga eckloniae]
MFLAIKYVPNFVESKRKIKKHNEIEIAMTSNAQRFGYNIKSTITRSRINNSYNSFKAKILNGEKTNFQDLKDLEITKKELVEQAKLRDKLMADISGRKEEFEDE